MLFGTSPHALSEAECWHLLSVGGIGRLAITIGALPRIVPARFAVDGDRVKLCLGDQDGLTDAVDNTVVALAVDSLADNSPHGWLVEINGIASLVPEHHSTHGCAHQTTPLVTSIAPTLVTGSTYRLCDSAVPGPIEHTEP
jgi:hypothetical protein